MCGIVGVVKDTNAKDIIFNGLRNLEYRGYDSAGIFLYPDKIYKTTSRVDSLKNEIENLSSSTGIGHTRWATTGRVSTYNAHPHSSYHGYVTLVHNGIITNYNYYKDLLIKEGYEFSSETDTEVIANLIEFLYLKNGNMEKTLLEVMKNLKGEMALIISIKGNEGLYFVKRGSPLVLAQNNNSFYIASDNIAIPTSLTNFYYPRDEEFGYLNESSYIYIHNKKTSIPFKYEKPVEVSDNKIESCYYLKELYEEADVIKKIYNTYIDNNEINKKYKSIYDELKTYNTIHLIGCGSSYNAAKFISYNNDRVIPHIGSEDIQINEKDFYILISQSGETFDLIKIAKKIKRTKAKLLVLTNVKHSTLARMSKYLLLMGVGREQSVAATKSFLASILILTIFINELKNYTSYFKKIYRCIRYSIKNESKINGMALEISKLKSLYYIGKGLDKRLADEGSLKLKEISYLHVESIFSGELKHGPLATVDKNFGVLAICSTSKNEQKIITSLEEVSSRNAPTFLISTNKEISSVPVLKGPKYLPNIGILIILQILAYKVANILKRDIDKPKNLAKSVTVI